MNNEWDKFSMPKQVGIDLVKMHLERVTLFISLLAVRKQKRKQ